MVKAAAIANGKALDNGGGTESSSEVSKPSSKSVKERQNRRKKRKEEKKGARKISHSDSLNSLAPTHFHFPENAHPLNYDMKWASPHQVQYHVSLVLQIVLHFKVYIIYISVFHNCIFCFVAVFWKTMEASLEAEYFITAESFQP